MDDAIQQIKDRIDVVDLISDYIKVQKAGANFKANCPFHNEKTPSFFISPERQNWHCFGCNLGGSIFDFIMEYDGIEFSEALRILAARAGVELGTFDREFQNTRSRLLEAVERSTKFFEKQLWFSNLGQKALEYLHKRGLKDETIKKFRLGFAPDSWDSLFTFLKKSGHSSEDIERAGLIIKKEKATGFYDRFRSRIIFPISDSQGEVVGYSGRIFSITGEDEKSAKYINSPQTPIYDKSRILYGLDKTRQAIKKAGSCLVVEGNMDVIMAYQAGVDNCVASSGTALTEQQISIIKRYTNKIKLNFDTDSAGQAATERGVISALKLAMNVSIVTLDDPECKDPADYVLKHGEDFKKIAEKSRPVVEFYIDKLSKEHDFKTAEGKSAIVSAIMPFVKSIGSTVEQAHWINELALVTQSREDDLREELKKAEAYIPATVDSVISKKNKKMLDNIEKDILEDYTISLIFRHPLWYKSSSNNLSTEAFSDNAKLVLKYLAQNLDETGNMGKFIDSLPEELRGIAENWYLYSQMEWIDLEEKETEEEITKMVNYLKKRNVVSQLSRLEYMIKEAERLQDRNKVDMLAREFTKLSQQL